MFSPARTNSWEAKSLSRETAIAWALLSTCTPIDSNCRVTAQPKKVTLGRMRGITASTEPSTSPPR